MAKTEAWIEGDALKGKVNFWLDKGERASGEPAIITLPLLIKGCEAADIVTLAKIASLLASSRYDICEWKILGEAGVGWPSSRFSPFIHISESDFYFSGYLSRLAGSRPENHYYESERLPLNLLAAIVKTAHDGSRERFDRDFRKSIIAYGLKKIGVECIQTIMKQIDEAHRLGPEARGPAPKAPGELAMDFIAEIGVQYPGSLVASRRMSRTFEINALEVLNLRKYHAVLEAMSSSEWYKSLFVSDKRLGLEFSPYFLSPYYSSPRLTICRRNISAKAPVFKVRAENNVGYEKCAFTGFEVSLRSIECIAAVVDDRGKRKFRIKSGDIHPTKILHTGLDRNKLFWIHLIEEQLWELQVDRVSVMRTIVETARTDNALEALANA